MRNLFQLTLLLAVLAIPAYKWATPTLIPFSGKAFTVEKLEWFWQQEKEQESLKRDIRTAKETFSHLGCGFDTLPVSTAFAARENHVSVRLVAAQVVAESSCNPDAVSDKGAIGLMQVNPKYWPYSRQELRDPARNLQVGTAILASYIRQTGSVRDGLRHYYGIGSDPSESDAYADKILSMTRR